MHLRINVQEVMCAQGNMVKKSVQGNFVDGHVACPTLMQKTRICN